MCFAPRKRKATFLGPVACGKTSLVKALQGFGDDTTNEYVPTIGVDVYVFKEDPKTSTALRSGGPFAYDSPFTVQCWDCSGDDRFLPLLPMTLRNCDMTIICYDVNDRSSFDTLRNKIIPDLCGRGKNGKQAIVRCSSDGPLSFAFVGCQLDKVLKGQQSGERSRQVWPREAMDLLEFFISELKGDNGVHVAGGFVAEVAAKPPPVPTATTSRIKDAESANSTGIEALRNGIFSELHRIEKDDADHSSSTDTCPLTFLHIGDDCKVDHGPSLTDLGVPVRRSGGIRLPASSFIPERRRMPSSRGVSITNTLNHNKYSCLAFWRSRGL